MMYFISRFVFRTILNIFFGLEVKGRENVPRKGPFIIASNHVSFVDPAVVGVVCPTPLVFVAKKELFNIPVLGSWVKSVGCIPIERDSKNPMILKRAVKKMREGKALGIFPEGTRSMDGRLKSAEPGIGFIALKTGAPIIPVYLSGTDKALPPGRVVPRPCKVTAKIGKPIDITESLETFEKKKKYESIGERIMDSISRLKNE